MSVGVMDSLTVSNFRKVPPLCACGFFCELNYVHVAHFVLLHHSFRLPVGRLVLVHVCTLYVCMCVCVYVCVRVCVCVCECMSYGEKRDGVWRREMRRGHEGIKQERSQFHPQILEGMRVKGWIRMRSIGKRDSSWTKLFVLCVRVRGL